MNLDLDLRLIIGAGQLHDHVAHDGVIAWEEEEEQEEDEGEVVGGKDSSYL